MCCQPVQLGGHDDIVKSDTEGREQSGHSTKHSLRQTSLLSSRLKETSSHFREEGDAQLPSVDNKRDLSKLCINTPVCCLYEYSSVHAAVCPADLSREIGERQPGRHRQSLRPTRDRVDNQRPLRHGRANEKGTGINASKSASGEQLRLLC